MMYNSKCKKAKKAKKAKRGYDVYDIDDKMAKMMYEYSKKYDGEEGKFNYIINGQRFDKSDVEIVDDGIIITTDVLDYKGDRIIDTITGGYKRKRSWLTLNPESKVTVNISVSSFTIKRHEII